MMLNRAQQSKMQDENNAEEQREVMGGCDPSDRNRERKK